MSRKRNRGFTSPPFVTVTWDVLNSAAFKTMPFSARACLPYWLGKPKAPVKSSEYYDKEFCFSYQEARRYGFAPATFWKVICEIVEKGFADPKDKGGLKSDGLGYNRFCLSRRWEKFGKPDFIPLSWPEFMPRRKQKPIQKLKSIASKTEINRAKECA